MAVTVKCFTPFQTNSYLQNMKPSVVSKPWNHLGSEKDILTPMWGTSININNKKHYPAITVLNLTQQTKDISLIA